MANKKTRAVTHEELTQIVNLIRSGYITADGKHIRPNPRVAAIIILQSNTCLRIGDAIRIRLVDFTYSDGKYRFNNFKEQKTGKVRNYSITTELYSFLQTYALDNGIKPTDRLFPVSVRTVQHHIQLACDYLGLENCSTHSFRKYMATQIFMQTKDLEITRSVLLHSSIMTSQIYLSYEPEKVENALQQIVAIPS